jgi:plastocyanin
MHRTARRLMPLAAIVAAFVVITGLVVGYGARGTSAHEGEAHPAHIHSGSCATLGDVVYPLSDVGGAMMDANGTPIAGTAMGAADAIPVDVSVTTVQADLNTLLGSEYAINVHESAENIGNYIACGDLGGEVMGSDLAIGLAELNDSGYSGVAWLHDNGDGTTNVSVFLTEAAQAEGAESEAGGAATAEAGGEAATNAVAVDIKDFAYVPPTIEVAVGTTVTWTNSDSAPHTATQDGGGFQSDRLNQGESYSFTFDTAGTFAYHCEFHPNMSGTVVVQ